MIRQRITRRIQELQAHQAALQTRADSEKADAQRQIDALTAALVVLTPETEAVFDTLLQLRLLPTKE